MIGSGAGPLTDWTVEYIFDVVGRIFIASLKLLVVPLVFVLPGLWFCRDGRKYQNGAHRI